MVGVGVGTVGARAAGIRHEQDCLENGWQGVL